MMDKDHFQVCKNHHKIHRALVSIILLITFSSFAPGQQIIVPLGAAPSFEKKSGEAPQNPPSSIPATAQQPAPAALPALTRDEAVRLALAQASAFQQAQINERLAVEDVRQSQKAFLPKLSSTTSFIYTSPAPGVTTPATPSFIAANAITEFQPLVVVSGDIDLNGRLRATLRRSQALLEAARAGTAMARRALELSTNEAYYGLAVATARRRGAEQNLSAAQDFEHNTELSLK